MTTAAIHRVIERHAVACPDDVAILEGNRHVTYRELNQCANALGRRLMCHGFRRGAHATVRMARGTDLACMLLAILKCGGSYTWIDPVMSPIASPLGVSIRVTRGETEDTYLHLECASLFYNVRGATSPNLPILTRGSDIACVLRTGDRVIHIPHDALTSVQTADTSAPAPWNGEPGALDVWVALMAGRTVVVDSKPLEAAA